MSRLARLYRYAKAGRSESLENFTTEALASAIESDSTPLLHALRRRGIAPDGLRGNVVVHTQVGKRKPNGTTAFMDLEARFVEGSTTNAVFWVEVKLSAGEHGDQLEVYEEIARARPRPTGATWRPSSRSTAWHSIRRME